MRKIVLGLGFFFLFGNVFSQEDISQLLKFSEKTYDISRIREDKGKASHVYMITNLGEKNARLLKCESDPKWKNITFEWDVNVIKQYERIHLKAIMDPTGMRYSFQIPFKLTMLIGKDTVVYDMKLKGYVDPKPATKEELYGMQEGNLKYINNSKNFPKMSSNSVMQDTFRFMNVWDSVMTFKPGNIPNCIKVVYLTPSLQPGGEGMLVYSVHAELMNDWGNVFNTISMFTNDPKNSKKSFYVNVEIYDDFNSWTPEQLKNAPRILIDEEVYDFKECISGDEIKHDFRITNIGKSNLIIRKVKTSCGCTTSKLDKDTLAPGESTLVKAIFRTGGKKGYQPKDIYLISNDPEQPKSTMKIVGNIKEKKNN